MSIVEYYLCFGVDCRFNLLDGCYLIGFVLLLSELCWSEEYILLFDGWYKEYPWFDYLFWEYPWFDYWFWEYPLFYD